jgi:FAD/FMN-containing dehydrogenase
MSIANIKPENITSLSTIHGNFVHPIENLFTISNGTESDVLAGYNETTNLIAKFIGQAGTEGKSVRALGGNWSWTKVGYTNNWILSSIRLNRIKRIAAQEVDPSYGVHEQDKLVFVQCGCSILELNRALESLGRSIKTSGASNGQTIAGLISNGTHGAAIDFGSSPDFVTGLHIILSLERHVFLEPASRPVVSDLFIEKIGAELIRNDDLFYAALVSFGSFGFIHGVMIETDPLFLLNMFRKRIASADITPLMETLDFTNTSFLPHPGRRPHHFQVTINPFATDEGYYTTVMYKEPHRDSYPRIQFDASIAGPGEDAPILLGRLTGLLPGISPLIVKQTLKAAYKNIDNAWGTHGEVFAATPVKGKVLSCAIGIPVAHTNEVLDICFHLNKKHSFVGIFACRFIKPTKALLGFTRFSPTCVAEFDSFETGSTWRFYRDLWQELENSGIPYTFHWGKVNNLDAAKVAKMYGPGVEKWIQARNSLLSPKMLQVFTNDFMKQTGLDLII